MSSDVYLNMKNLEAKHLAPYLPYGLKVLYEDTNKQYPLVIHNPTVSMIAGFNITEVLNEPMIKPLLRRMSDFDKVHNDFDLSTDFETAYYSGTGLEAVFVNTSDKTYLSDIITVSTFLFENHFDVFGLIEQDLAIDINAI